jgi:hypothetical protein
VSWELGQRWQMQSDLCGASAPRNTRKTTWVRTRSTISLVSTRTVPSRRPTSVTPLPLTHLACAVISVSPPIPSPTGSTSPRVSSCASTSENPRSQARSPANPGAPVGGMYGAEAKGEPCVTPVLAKGE